MTKSDEYPPLGQWSDEELEARQPVPEQERRAHPRVPFHASVELIPPDGEVHECEGVNLSLGGVLLHKTGPGPLPAVDQLLVIDVAGEDVSLDAVVVRVEPDARRFAARFLDLDPPQCEYLARTVDEESGSDASGKFEATHKP